MVDCPCPPIPPEVEGILTGGKKPLWRYEYKWSHVASEKIRATLVIPFKHIKEVTAKTAKRFTETKPIRSLISRSFIETIQIIGRQLGILFEETNPIKAIFIREFEETQPIMGVISWEFTLTAHTKIIGKVTSRERELIEELKWL